MARKTARPSASVSCSAVARAADLTPWPCRDRKYNYRSRSECVAIIGSTATESAAIVGVDTVVLCEHLHLLSAIGQ